MLNRAVSEHVHISILLCGEIMSHRSGGAGSGYSSQFSGLTPSQFNHLSATQPGFVADSRRVDTYSNPAWNVADRNWQEVLRKDSTYTWSTADQSSWKQNCNFGPHNAPSQLDSILFKK